MQQKPAQTPVAIHEYPRQPEWIVGRPCHSGHDGDGRGVPRAPHQLDGLGAEVPEGIGKMLYRDAQHVAQRNPTFRDLVKCGLLW